MSLSLFKMTFRKNWSLLIIFFGILTMYMAVMISMYDPNDMEALMAMLKLFPEEMMKAMGFGTVVTDLTGYLSSWLYGLLMFAFPMIYSIILANRLASKMVDNSSFAYLLSTPNSRVKIIVTQGVYALVSIIVLFVALFGAGVVICESMFSSTLDINAFLRLNVTTMLVNMLVMMICFFFSCLFNESKYSLGFGSGLPIMFLLMNMLGNVSKSTELLKKISIYGLYDPIELVNGASVITVNTIYIVFTIVLFFISIYVFNKKRLPL